VSVAEMRAPSRICWALGGKVSALATDVHARAITIDLKFMLIRWRICWIQQALWQIHSKKGTTLGKFQKIIVLVLMIEGWANWMVRV
jgi:hypothetical protein